VFRKKMPEPEHTELIDRLLNVDPAERKMVIFEALQTGEIRGHEVDGVLGLVARLERVAAPQSKSAPTSAQQPAA
jgi:hypothetical protein